MTTKFFIIPLFLLFLVSFAFGQNKISPAKKALVAKLTANTSEIFPAEALDELFKTVQAEKMSETAKGITDTIAAKIDSSDKLSAQEKADIKAKIPELSQKLTRLAMDFLGKDFSIKNWTESAFQKYYSSKFTNAELRQLNNYFQTPNGKEVVQLFNILIIGEITDKEGASNIQKDAVMESFMKKPFAPKFFKVLLENVVTEVMTKTDNWSKTALDKINKSLENGEMKKLMEDFIVANVKP